MSKSLRLFALLFVALALLTAGLNAPAARAAADTVNLTLEGASSGPAETARLQQIVDTWNKAHADIQVKLSLVPDYDTTLAKELASGTPPDVFYVDSFKFLDLVKAGALLPVGDKLTNVDDFYPALRDVFTANGKFYCPPKDFSTLALQVNTDMLAKAGVKVPTTWDELAAAAKTLTTKDVSGFVTPTDPARFYAFLYAAGGSVTNADLTKMTINSPEGLKALKFYTDLYANGYAKQASELGGAGWPGEAFEKGKAAMIFEGNWLLGDMKEKAPNTKFQSVELPAGPGGKATMVFTVCYGVAAQGKNPDAAVKFLDYLVGPEAMKSFTDLGFLPSRKSLSDQWIKQFPDYQVYLKAADYAHRWGFGPGFSAVNDKISEQIGLIFAGSQTPEEALKVIEKVGNEVLAKNGGSAGSSGAATMAATMAATASK